MTSETSENIDENIDENTQQRERENTTPAISEYLWRESEQTKLGDGSGKG